MFASGGGAWKFPPLHATRNAATIEPESFGFMWTSCSWQSAMAKGSPGATAREGGVALEACPRGRLERGSGERVLEEVLLGAVVEQVADLHVDPQRAGDPRAGACVDADLRG